MSQEITRTYTTKICDNLFVCTWKLREPQFPRTIKYLTTQGS